MSLYFLAASFFVSPPAGVETIRRFSRDSFLSHVGLAEFVEADLGDLGVGKGLLHGFLAAIRFKQPKGQADRAVDSPACAASEPRKTAFTPHDDAKARAPMAMPRASRFMARWMS